MRHKPGEHLNIVTGYVILEIAKGTEWPTPRAFKKLMETGQDVPKAGPRSFSIAMAKKFRRVGPE